MQNDLAFLKVGVNLLKNKFMILTSGAYTIKNYGFVIYGKWTESIVGYYFLLLSITLTGFFK